MDALPLPGPLVTVDWLADHLDHPGLLLLDASVGPARGTLPPLPGARTFDIDGELSDHGSPLPHTMPDAERFQTAMRALGLHDTGTVVVYDNNGIYSSARAWWMLRAMGFDRAAVLDGGRPAWTAAGLPDGDPAPQAPAPGDFTARPRPHLLVDADTVAAALTDPDTAVLDARTRERFTGEAPEPRPGLRGGHMPGSRSLPFAELQHPDGRMLPAAELRTRIADRADGRDRLVTSCGSGVTACVLALGATLAGYCDVTVYDGSWSEWGLPSSRPVATIGHTH
ncbi:sulfurtransferase [Kitasatospora terrestris]|uniref:Sulfurtransferase n=1 Tax=Kitasatospora terrestris TaxID=258051 RepID=A0ABP9DUM1_9ACTN